MPCAARTPIPASSRGPAHNRLGHNVTVENIGRYRIDRRIGAGAFATVYQAFDDELQSVVAIKVLSLDHANDPDIRRRFLDEARLLRRIRDERVVRVHDIGKLPDGRPYFVMDHCDGGSFTRLRTTQVAPARVLHLCAEAARGLEVLHRHNMLHRDVTPGNLLLSHSASGVRVVLADLGVAKSMAERGDDPMTVGTPAYMALEQASGGVVDERSDIYSLGAVTYTLLAGSTPFGIRSLDDLLGRNPAIGPAPIADRIEAPALLDDLLAATLSAKPGDRPPSAEILAAALDGIADAMTTQPNSPGSASTPNLATAPRYAAPVISEHETPGHETPGRMLDNYLGQGRYQVRPAIERHGAGFYLYASAATIALLALVVWLTITYLVH